MQKACHKSCHMCQMYVNLVKIKNIIEEDDFYFCKVNLKENEEEYEVNFDIDFERIASLHTDLAFKYIYSIVNRFKLYFGRLENYSKIIPDTPLGLGDSYSFEFLKNKNNLEGSKNSIYNFYKKICEDFKESEIVMKEGNELYDKHSKDKEL